MERHLARIYCLEGCQRIIVAGDGAAWIRQGAEELGAEYQYCRFHLERDLRKLFGDEVELKKSISKTLQNNDNKGFNMIMDALLVEEKKSEQKKQIEEFRTLINNVWEGITDWRERNKTNSEDARGLGVIEPNVGHAIAKRFKHQGASWSLTGAINLAKVRCAVRNKNLIDLMRLLGPPAVQEKTVERIDTTNGYWARKQADGLLKKDPSDWCKASLAAAKGPEQRAREFARLIGQLTPWPI